MSKNTRTLTVETGQLTEVQLGRLLRSLTAASNTQNLVAHVLRDVADLLARYQEPGQDREKGLRLAAFHLAALREALPARVETFLHPAPGEPISPTNGKVPAGWKLVRLISIYEGLEDATDWTD